MIIEERPFKELTEFVINSGWGRATASNWIREIKAALDAVGEVRHGEDYDALRLQRVKEYAERAEHYREEADDALARYHQLHAGTWKPVEGFEKLAIKYTLLEMAALHWDKIPPDRDMSLEEVQLLVMRSLDRHLPKFLRQHVVSIMRSCERVLAEMPKTGPAGNADVESVL